MTTPPRSTAQRPAAAPTKTRPQTEKPNAEPKSAGRSRQQSTTPPRTVASETPIAAPSEPAAATLTSSRPEILAALALLALVLASGSLLFVVAPDGFGRRT